MKDENLNLYRIKLSILLFYVTGWSQEHTVYSTDWQKSRWRKHTGWQSRTYGKEIELFWKFRIAATVGNSLNTGMYSKYFLKTFPQKLQI